MKKPALKKNPFIKDIKEHNSVKMYKSLSKTKRPISKEVLESQKSLANNKILNARVLNKLKDLHERKQIEAINKLNEIFQRFIDKPESHSKFVKLFAKEINRKEGKEVLEIINKYSLKILNK